MAARREFRGWALRFSLRGLFALVTLACLAFAVPGALAHWNLRQLGNEDVRVDGTYIGLWLHLDGRAAKRIEWLGRWANPALERALADPERFVAAHVLLGRINERSQQLSASHWDGMQVTLKADGTADVHPEQIPDIQALWKRRLHGE